MVLGDSPRLTHPCLRGVLTDDHNTSSCSGAIRPSPRFDLLDLDVGEITASQDSIHAVSGWGWTGTTPYRIGPADAAYVTTIGPYASFPWPLQIGSTARVFPFASRPEGLGWEIRKNHRRIPSHCLITIRRVNLEFRDNEGSILSPKPKRVDLGYGYGHWSRFF